MADETPMIVYGSKTRSMVGRPVYSAPVRFTKTGECTTCGVQGELATGIGWYCDNGCVIPNTPHTNEEIQKLRRLVTDFADAMIDKLTESYLTKGRTGWDDPAWTTDHIEQAIREHIDKGDMIDVANLAAFHWFRSK